MINYFRGDTKEAEKTHNNYKKTTSSLLSHITPVPSSAGGDGCLLE